jgi:hypothetical protein
MGKRSAPPSVRSVLLQALDTAFDKKSWHGATLMGALRGVDAATAIRKVHRRKSIWEQTLHAAYWKQRVLNKLAGPSRFPRRGSNWPAVPGSAHETAHETAWQADLALLRDIHGRLRAAVMELPKLKLDPKTIWLIQGAAAHDLYHAGQIKLLLRLLA